MEDRVVRAHGGYKSLAAYAMSEIVHDGTVAFARLYDDYKSRTQDQMVQAAWSCKQNLVEGSQASGTSKKTELKLVGVARASLEELLTDTMEFLRQGGHTLWPKDESKAVYIRGLCCEADRSYMTYKTYIEEKGGGKAANTLACLVHQTSCLIDQLLRQLDRAFLEEGGVTERLYRLRKDRRQV